MTDPKEFIRWLTDPTVITVFSIVFGAGLLSYLVRRVVEKVEVKAQITRTIWDDAVIRSIRKPLSWLIWILGIAWAAEIISQESDAGLMVFVEPLRFIAVIGLIALFLSRLTREVEIAYIDDGADITTANAIGKLARASIWITAALSVLQTLGVSVSGILAFGGVGGIAVGFAARDLLANFFGGLMLYLDQPFKVGDWIRSPDREIEGTVIAIGWRLTEIRTFDQRPLYVPNSAFTTIAIENPSRMRNRRIYETIGIRYADLGQMDAIVTAVKAMLEAHDAIDTGRTLIVNFNAFNNSSVDFFIYTFTKTTNWVEFHGIKQDVLLQVAGIIENHQAEIAFPTRTLHLAAPEPDDNGDSQ